jgi:hypothetical protein
MPTLASFVKNGVVVAAVSLCALITGSCGAIRHENLAMTRGELVPRPNTAIVREGITQRQEVLREFERFDTDASGDRFFWARWAERFWENPKAEGERSYFVIKNLFVEFDEAGRVSRWSLPSDKDVPEALYRAAQGLAEESEVSGALTLESPEEGLATIQGDCLRFEPRKHPSRRFEVPIRLVRRVTSDDGSSVARLQLVIRLADSAKPVRRIKIAASPKEALQLMQQLHHAGASILSTSGSAGTEDKRE